MSNTNVLRLEINSEINKFGNKIHVHPHNVTVQCVYADVC